MLIVESSGNSSVGRASPCQGGGREFESRFPLHLRILPLVRAVFLYKNNLLPKFDERLFFYTNLIRPGGELIAEYYVVRTAFYYACGGY